ncbi:DUF2851 family protein [Psychroserpens algicola]|uniref:DUF2851 family protein n=1 Tax=Psychroserpens algicola TaxID=1719034 RepID=A0ABT0HAI2_9FLAO|nr:DUF2851 family protein [Psychroserpens algicola]MCK8481361.1 DUF2851 family protein [Psychroserpens algicola]
MIENFLYYVWQYKKLNVLHLKTTQHEPLEIISVGLLNLNSGPDFFNGQLRIGEQLWAGNIEIHVKSSDWFLHNHEQDAAYDNVILHVVFEHDTEIFRNDNTIIPTLELKSVIDKDLLDTYYRLFSAQNKWIYCENDFANVSEFTIYNWLERLYIERLERKSKGIEQLLKTSKYDWEAVLFKLLVKNFGLKVNGEAFASLARSVDFSVVRKQQSSLVALEALLFGQTGLLDHKATDGYHVKLQSEYQFLKQKYQLNNHGVVPCQFFRLRPPNFPTIRLSQLANLYHTKQQLFSKVISAATLSDFYLLFDVATSEYWTTHYTFGKSAKSSTKKMSRSFINLLLINTIIPLKFYYAQHKGDYNHEMIMTIIRAIPSEKNNIVNGFNQIKQVSKSAMESQALIQLKSEYCEKQQCLKCAIGNALLSK